MQFIVCKLSLKVDKEKRKQIHFDTPTATRIKLESYYCLPHGHRENENCTEVAEERGGTAKTFLFIEDQAGVWQCARRFIHTTLFNSNKFDEIGSIISITDEETGSEGSYQKPPRW